MEAWEVYMTFWARVRKRGTNRIKGEILSGWFTILFSLFLSAYSLSSSLKLSLKPLSLSPPLNPQGHSSDFLSALGPNNGLQLLIDQASCDLRSLCYCLVTVMFYSRVLIWLFSLISYRFSWPSLFLFFSYFCYYLLVIAWLVRNNWKQGVKEFVVLLVAILFFIMFVSKDACFPNIRMPSLF